MRVIKKIKAYIISFLRNRIKQKRFLRNINYVRNDLEKQLLPNEYISKGPCILTEDQKRQIDVIWKDRYPKPSRITYRFHDYYYKATGVFDPHFIPNDLWYEIIDRHFNDSNAAIENKCYFGKLFPDVLMPEILAYRIKGVWLDSDYKAVKLEDLFFQIGEQEEVVIKQASGTSGGKNVYFVHGSNIITDAKTIISRISKDIVVQLPIKQHPQLAKLNPESVNSIRLLSFLSEGKAKVYSSVLRIGAKGKRVDNGSSGGITCGINADGYLKRTAHSLAGQSFDFSPATGIPFASIKVPSFFETVELVQSLHLSFPVYRIASWDIAIDESGKPVLIEVNYGRGGIDLNQLNNGPLFGNDQEKILSEILWEIPSYSIKL